METKDSKSLTERMIFLVTKAQKEDVHQRAADAGMGIAEYIRAQVFPENPEPEWEQRLKILEDRISELESQRSRT